MPGLIQRPARGLVDLLGMKATGASPPLLGDSVAATLPLKYEYLLDRLQFAQHTTGIAIPGVGVATAGAASGPSSGFLRYVFGVDYGTTAVAAAATIQFHLGAARGGSTTVACLFPGMDSGLLSAGQAASKAIWFSDPMIMQAGDILAYRTIIYTGAPAITPTGTIYFADVGI